MTNNFPSDISGIHPNALRFIRSIGARETGFKKSEAASDFYNQPSRNVNVRNYGQSGADYGFYQTNRRDVQDAVRRGVPQGIADALDNGGGKGNYTVEQQTVAMNAYLQKLNPRGYDAMLRGDWDSANKAFNGKWPSLPGGRSYRSANDAKANAALAGQILPGMVSSDADSKQQTSQTTKDEQIASSNQTLPDQEVERIPEKERRAIETLLTKDEYKGLSPEAAYEIIQRNAKEFDITPERLTEIVTKPQTEEEQRLEKIAFGTNKDAQVTQAARTDLMTSGDGIKPGTTTRIDQASQGTKGLNMHKVDTRLKVVGDAAIRAFEAKNPGYTVKVISGFRPNDDKKHGRGHAIDYQIIDPKGKPLPNLGGITGGSHSLAAGARAGDYVPEYLELMRYMEAARLHMAKTDPSYAQMGQITPGIFFSSGAWLDSMHASFGERGKLGDVYRGFKSKEELQKAGVSSKVIEAVERAREALRKKGMDKPMSEEDMKKLSDILYASGAKPAEVMIEPPKNISDTKQLDSDTKKQLSRTQQDEYDKYMEMRNIAGLSPDEVNKIKREAIESVTSKPVIDIPDVMGTGNVLGQPAGTPTSAATQPAATPTSAAQQAPAATAVTQPAGTPTSAATQPAATPTSAAATAVTQPAGTPTSAAATAVTPTSAAAPSSSPATYRGAQEEGIVPPPPVTRAGTGSVRAAEEESMDALRTAQREQDAKNKTDAELRAAAQAGSGGGGSAGAGTPSSQNNTDYSPPSPGSTGQSQSDESLCWV